MTAVALRNKPRCGESYCANRSALETTEQGPSDHERLNFGAKRESHVSAGWITELAYLPFSHGGPSFRPWLNFRIGVQYTRWTKFDGSTTNIDGFGRSAHDNNTLLVYAWTMF